MTAFYSPCAVLSDIFLADFSLPGWSWTVTGNFQIYQGALFSAVPTGEAVLKSWAPVKAGTSFRLGESSIKLSIIKEEAESKWTFLAADDENLIYRNNHYVIKPHVKRLSEILGWGVQMSGWREGTANASQPGLLFVYLLSDPDLNLILQQPCCCHAQNFNCDTFRLWITVSVKERGKLRVIGHLPFIERMGGAGAVPLWSLGVTAQKTEASW